MKNLKYQLRNPNLYLCVGVICAVVAILCLSNKCMFGNMIVNVAYGYISSFIVYALTVILKNKMDRERFMWQIYDMMNELSDKIQELNRYPLDDKLTMNSDGDYELSYNNLCKLRSLVDNVKYEVDSVERIYYNLLKHSESEAFVIVCNAINNLRKTLCKCVVFNADKLCEVKDSPAMFHKIEIDLIKDNISALIKNIDILQASITKEIEKK